MTNEELDKARAEQAKRLCVAAGEPSVIAARLAREGWTPPAAVDPDREEAITLAKSFGLAHYIPVLEGIKRGRALAAAEAKPGLVWKVHDRSRECPVESAYYVWVKDAFGTKSVQTTGDVWWPNVTHYCEIIPPDDVA